jgi:hypothetical protein
MRIPVLVIPALVPALVIPAHPRLVIPAQAGIQ